MSEPMQTEHFGSLEYRDFDNEAVLYEIHAALKERDKLKDENKRVRKAAVEIADRASVQCDKMAEIKAENNRLREMLQTCRTAVGSLPIDALGRGRDGEMEWPLRDELIDHINRTLNPTDPEKVDPEAKPK